MAVRKIGKSWWVDFRFGGVRYRKRSPINTRAGSQEYESALRQRLVRGESFRQESSAPKGPILFSEAAARWFDTYVAANTKPSTAQFWKHTLRKHLLPHLGARRLADVTSYDIETFKSAKLEQGLAPSSINSMLIVLRCLLNRAVEWGWLEKAPKVKNLKLPPWRFDFLSASEANQLISASRHSPHYTMILTALRTGMRQSELIGLRWEDIDLAGRLITVRRAIVLGQESSPKSNRERRIPMAEDLGNALRTSPRTGTLVFPNSKGTARSPDAATAALHAICKKAGIRRVGWHVLRHSFASQLAMAGAPLPAIQALLGHASIRMTMRYSHMMPSTLRDTIELLDPRPTRPGHSSGQAVVNDESPGASEPRVPV